MKRKMTDQPIPEKTNRYDKKNMLVIALSVVLLAVMVMFFMQRREHKGIVQELNIEKDSIQVELEQMVVNYDSLKTDNDELNNHILITQSEIKNLLVEIDQVKKASYREISQYRDKVNTLRGIMKSLYNQIDSLNERNKVLFAENQEVKQMYSEEKNRNEELEIEKAKLEERVKKAQILEALNLRGTGLTPRDRETDKVARTQKLIISFTLSKNLTAPRGAKNVYIRIMRPDQLLLLNEGENLFRFEDLKIPYTAMREVNYEGMELPVNIFWDNTGKEALLPGTYTVDVFADGYNIGTAEFVLLQ
ncbi:coiled-coil domain-containing protein [Roseimarinus sediminis]|uniref:coiled-coil domain-containing protein n=1 Tax=Roseimarinus sediminis TaxID=1610899 RepID=UPI003D20EE46